MFFVDWFEEHGNIRLRSTRGESMRSKLLTHCAGGDFGHANNGSFVQLESCTENDDSWRGKC